MLFPKEFLTTMHLLLIYELKNLNHIVIKLLPMVNLLVRSMMFHI
jgi:hypothetical protein